MPCVQEEEKRLRDEHISYLEQQKRLEQLIKQKVLILEEEAKKRIAQYLKEKRQLMKKMAVSRVSPFCSVDMNKVSSVNAFADVLCCFLSMPIPV